MSLWCRGFVALFIVVVLLVWLVFVFSLHKRVCPTCMFADVVFPIVVLVGLAAIIVAAVIAVSVMESTCFFPSSLPVPS